MTFIKTYKKYLITAALLWAVCAILFMLIFLFVLGPQREHEARTAKKIDEQKQLYESALTATQKDTRNKLNEKLVLARQKVSNFLIEFKDSANLTFDISQIANEKDVTSFSIKNNNNDGGYASIPNCDYLSENQFNIRFNAGFNQFATFLNALERHQPVLFVDQFTIVQSRQEDSEYHVSLNVSFFVKKPESGKTAEKDSV